MQGVNDANIVTGILQAGRIGEASGFDPTYEISGAAENTILFGLGMKRGTNAEVQVKAWDGAAATDKFVGFAEYSTQGRYATNDLSVLAGYKQYDSVLILKRGVVWLAVSASGTNPAVGDNISIMADGKVAKRVAVAGDSGTYAAQVQGQVLKIGTYATVKYAMCYVDIVETPETIQI